MADTDARTDLPRLENGKALSEPLPFPRLLYAVGRRRGDLSFDDFRFLPIPAATFVLCVRGAREILFVG